MRWHGSALFLHLIPGVRPLRRVGEVLQMEELPISA